MSKRNTRCMGPAAACNACGKVCWTLMEEGITCYHCGQGVFVHRRFWDMAECPECHTHSAGICKFCNGIGWLITPGEDFADDELRSYWRELPDRYTKYRQPVPPAIVEAAAWADCS